MGLQKWAATWYARELKIGDRSTFHAVVHVADDDEVPGEQWIKLFCWSVVDGAKVPAFGSSKAFRMDREAIRVAAAVLLSPYYGIASYTEVRAQDVARAAGLMLELESRETVGV